MQYVHDALFYTKNSIIRSPKGGAYMRDFVETGSLKKWLLRLLLTSPSEHHKVRLSIDGQLCLNTFHMLHLLVLPHEYRQIHRKPFLSMTQTRECTREQKETVPRMGPEES